MKEHALRVLEYGQFLGLVSRYACSEPGAARLLALRPQGNLDPVAGNRMLFEAALALRRNGQSPPSARFHSPEEQLRRVAPIGAVLDVPDFLVIRDVIQAADTAKSFLVRKECESAFALRQLADELPDLSDLAGAIEKVIDPRDGTIRDDASERLCKIRARVATLTARIQKELEAFLRHPDFAGVFQEDFITRRHERFVLPVRREARRFEGILHDQSNSGETLFIEPRRTVELGNELEQMRLDERDEFRRLLAFLSDGVRARSAELAAAYERLVRYDTAYAVSAWAMDFDCCFPAMDGPLRLVGARHPLLLRHFRDENRVAELVPLDLDVPEGKNVVAVTGSNTGGKTVVLKTIGLLTLVAQTGLPVPARPGTCIPFFTSAAADIGDEQSIEQNLSTFSGHLRQIVNILDLARASDTLVLIDELGSGTDPGEGGPLGCAILEVLSRCEGLTFATTHLGAIKTYVHSHPRMENASMRFNVQTLRPEYRLHAGHAGASYALTIAERCGMPSDVLSLARGMMTAEQLRLETMLATLDAKELQLSSELKALRATRDEAVKARDDALRERDRIRHELHELRGERRKLLHKANAEAASLVANAQREVGRVLSAARERPEKDKARQLRAQLDGRAERLREGVEQTRDRPEDALAKEDLALGARVWLEKVKDHGRIVGLSGDGSRAVIDVGGLTFVTDSRELARARTPAAGPARPAAKLVHAPRRASPTELNLVGRRVEEALHLLETFLDGANLAGHTEVRIIHGYGTGALRDAVHEHLRRMRIGGFRMGRDGEDPGGTGVTIVSL